ncbi:MAG: type IV pilus biogenesis/stability protein PilW [Halieaceae bacterium]|nr:type IV pilus biogenesis/stability protein PilW [Halieaceae bacterium]
MADTLAGGRFIATASGRSLSAGLRRLAVLLLLLPGLTACITQSERVFNTEVSKEEALTRRVELARKYIGDGNWEDAKRNLKLAEEIDSRNPEVYEAFALVYQSTGEYEQAEENFERAISLQKDFSRARNNYAAFLYSQGRFEEAQSQLELVIKDTLYESRPQAFINLGLCRIRLGNDDGARDALRRALTMDRGNSLATIELASLEFRAGNYDLAERYLENYRKFRRQQPPRALWLGLQLAHARDDANAKASYALALRNLYPDSAEYRAYEQAVKNGEL